MFLTGPELRDLTGYVTHAKQREALARLGYKFDVRPTDGRPMVLRAQVEARQIGGKARRGPRFDALESA